MADFSDCPSYVQEFLFYMLTIRGRSARTVEAYHGDLRTFLRYIKCVKIDNSNVTDPEIFKACNVQNIPIEVLASLSLSDVYNYLNYVLTSRENSAKTRSRKTSSIRALFKYLTTKTQYLKDNPVKDLEVPAVKKSLPRYLTLEESLELLNGLNVNARSYQRDFCILTLFLNCGMRLSELVGINIGDIRFNKNGKNYVKLLGKGNKERIVYLNNACVEAIQAYEKVRKPTLNEAHKNAFFLSSRGTRITGRRVEQIVESCLSQCDLAGRGFSPHKLRHTAATLMYQHGHVDLLVLKEVLGHADLSTTEIYTHLSSVQKEQAANASPLASVAPKKQPELPKIKSKDKSNAKST